MAASPELLWELGAIRRLSRLSPHGLQDMVHLSASMSQD